ncbi:Branched-chain amino acid transport system carrier protein [Dissostichus eleginoides]|uniref:Branched-chain amino acid transport system carrier protein n=1 Tax=Dissostichus eleginoides TaxID=100907 RepID=A0AAD9BCW8_DISEL|nr:Branched-chain amino acid transport system carrier protein [Dissostichus eleginoides]
MLSGAAGSYGRTLTQGEQCPREQKRGGAGRDGQETGVTVTVTRYGLTTPLPIFIPILPQTTVENTNGNGRHHCGCL